MSSLLYLGILQDSLTWVLLRATAVRSRGADGIDVKSPGIVGWNSRKIKIMKVQCEVVNSRDNDNDNDTVGGKRGKL